MTEKKDDDIKIVMLPEAQAAIDADPELAKAMKEMNAAFHQAMHGVKTGKYTSFEDAMEAITGQRPQRVELDDDGEVPE